MERKRGTNAHCMCSAHLGPALAKADARQLARLRCAAPSFAGRSCGKAAGQHSEQSSSSSSSSAGGGCGPFLASASASAAAARAAPNRVLPRRRKPTGPASELVRRQVRVLVAVGGPRAAAVSLAQPHARTTNAGQGSVRAARTLEGWKPCSRRPRQGEVEGRREPLAQQVSGAATSSGFRVGTGS
eukprot:scaffold1180_cov321-Prasinococcus_capsulatus_cf.AAC.1